MPYLEDGTPVDIVLNPLGVPSRMNVGQILETALGFAGKELGEQVARTCLKLRVMKKLKNILKNIYGEEFIDAYEKEHGKEGIMELARKTAAKLVFILKHQFLMVLHFETDIKPLLQELDFPDSGAFKIRDGRTGEYFDQPVTVGIIYMMKLNHMVDDKLHARSVGPYSLVTQQPLGGKAQHGWTTFW